MRVFLMSVMGARAALPEGLETELAYPLVALYNERLPLRMARHFSLEISENNPIGTCPPDEIWVTGRENPLVRKKWARVEEGSGTRVYRFEDGDEKFVAKALASWGTTEADHRALVNEKLIMEIMEGVVPKLYPVERMTDACADRMYVTDMLGSKTLLGTRFYSEELYTFATLGRALGLLKNFHATGFVHGDVHWENFLTDESNPNSLVMIDYGHSGPYVTPMGRHYQESDKLDFSRSLNPANLSPWHLETEDISSYRPSRRDDMYRLAEMFYKLTNSRYQDEARQLARHGNRGLFGYGGEAIGPHEWARFKRDHLGFVVSPVLQQFYAYTLTLDYASEPLYDHWINMFNIARLEYVDTWF